MSLENPVEENQPNLYEDIEAIMGKPHDELIEGQALTGATLEVGDKESGYRIITNLGGFTINLYGQRGLSYDFRPDGTVFATRLGTESAGPVSPEEAKKVLDEISRLREQKQS